MVNEQFKQSQANRLELKQGGGCIGLFGLPFFLAGIFMLLIGMQVLKVSNANEIPFWGWIIILGMGLVFTAVGGTMVFGRKWITLDNATGRIWLAWGLIRPMRGRSYYLKDYSSLVLKFTAGDSDTADRYELLLRSGMQRELSLSSYQDFGIAHAQAELLVNFLGLPCEDQSTGNISIIKPGKTGAEPKRESANPQVQIALPPPEMRSVIDVINDRLSIKIPYPKYSPFNLLEAIIPLGIAIYFGTKVLPFFSATQTPLHVQSFFGGFVGLFFVFIPFISMLKKYMNTKTYQLVVFVDSSGIVMQHRKKKRSIAIERIIGLDYGIRDNLLDKHPNAPAWMYRLKRFATAQGVIVKSKDGIFYIGNGLADDEIVYLHALIKQFLGNN